LFYIFYFLYFFAFLLVFFSLWFVFVLLFGYFRTHAGLVSYYALFKGWLLISQPPSCRGTCTSFAILSGHFGTLAVVLGSFPLADGHYRSPTASRGPFIGYSEFGWG